MWSTAPPTRGERGRSWRGSVTYFQDKKITEICNIEKILLNLLMSHVETGMATVDIHIHVYFAKTVTL